MIDQALRYLVSLGEDKNEIITTKDGRSFSTRNWMEVDPRKRPSEIKTRSLSGFLDCLEEEVVREGNWILHIESPDVICLKSSYKQCESDADGYPERDTLYCSVAVTCDFQFGRWMPIEDFAIGLVTDFERNVNLESLYNHIRSVKSVNEVQSDDNGYSTSVSTKKGAMSRNEGKYLENPIALRPYRTFVEVEQPVGHYHYRLRENNGEIEAALFSVSGEIWKLAAMKSISEWFRERIADRNNINIVS